MNGLPLAISTRSPGSRFWFSTGGGRPGRLPQATGGRELRQELLGNPQRFEVFWRSTWKWSWVQGRLVVLIIINHHQTSSNILEFPFHLPQPVRRMVELREAGRELRCWYAWPPSWVEWSWLEMNKSKFNKTCQDWVRRGRSDWFGPVCWRKKATFFWASEVGMC